MAPNCTKVAIPDKCSLKAAGMCMEQIAPAHCVRMLVGSCTCKLAGGLLYMGLDLCHFACYLPASTTACLSFQAPMPWAFSLQHLP